MDSNNLGNFELLLKRSTAKKPSAIYNTTRNINNTTFKPQDVLDSVYSQIKTMQLADGRSETGAKDLKGVKSTFLAVSKLPLYNEVPKQTNTFETQCVSDTQLINIIEDAEAHINTHKGMTQEFDTDFMHSNMNTNNAVSFSQCKADRDNMIQPEEFETKFTQTNVDETVSFLHDKSERDVTQSPCNEKDQTQLDDSEANVCNPKNVQTLREICDNVLEENKSPSKMLHNNELCIENLNKEDKITCKIPGYHNKVLVNTETQKENEMIEGKVGNSTIMLTDVMAIDDIEEERSPSPVLKTKSKIKHSGPLVVSLESFESFERIAIPLIGSNSDFDTCKHLINSQILGGELCLNTDENVMFNENGQLSPIIKESCEIFQDNAADLIKTNIDTHLHIIEKRSESLKDEILFSSDEENDFIYRELQDMPLTAALDTSFDDHSIVLEETMYVGFQTASNKSIQICTDSLQKAQFILDEDSSINGKVFSLAELVEIRHEKSINTSIADLEVREKFNLKVNAEESISDSNEVSDMAQIKMNENNPNRDEKMVEEPGKKLPKATDYDNTIKKPPEKQCFVGFKTASNKKMDLSVKALDFGKKVFKDIDFDEKFDLMDKNSLETNIEHTKVMAIENIVNNSCDIDLQNDIDDKINDDLIIQEFANIEMSLEEEQKSCDEIRKAPFLCFKTASNRNIGISEEAKAKIKVVFQDIDLSEIDKNCEELDVTTKNPQLLSSEIKVKKDNLESTFIGFNTANNKNIEIPAKALAKTNYIFQDSERDKSDDNFELNIDSIQAFDYCNRPSTSKTAFVGFKTASNKDIQISEVALSKSSKIFKDIDNENPKNVENEVDTPKTLLKGFQTVNDELDIASESKLKGFQTASNKDVAVSKDALDASKKLFGEFNADKSLFVGFKTASNKKVNVSKEALGKCQKIFDDLDVFPTEINITNNLSKATMGFQTASNKNVEVSKEALEKTKSLFDDIELSEIKEHHFKGFETASNKNVEVSKEALEKTKSLFNDIEVKVPAKSIFSFQTGNNKKSNVSEDALNKSRTLLEDRTTNSKDGIPQDRSKNSLQERVKPDTAVNIDNIINTQVLNNFEESLCTEDFKETPINSKRSGSPILSCPRAKRWKKFETPYKDKKYNVSNDFIKAVENKITCTTKIKFTENYKKAKIYKLKDVKFGLGSKSGIDPYITNFNLDNVLNFEFVAERNELTETKVSIEELKRIFLGAVNKNLVPEGWLDNHLKLILWKLLSYEIRFHTITNLCTVQNVIDQLKYRYDKELYNAERPALRKIFERDDVPTKTMVLCVAGIYVDGVRVSSVTTTKDIELLLTDGWYFIKATIDKMLSKLVYDRRIVVGCKIATSGAELVNCEQGMSPWEDTTAVRLKIFGNSTRPARWDAKLGYTRAAILSQLSTVKVDGGKICRLRVFVARVYPMLYVEKFADGSTVTRSERLENLHQIKYETERELMMERIYEEVQKEFSDQESQDSELLDSGRRKSLDSGSQIAKMMKLSKDPMEFREQLTTSQVYLLQEHTCKYRERLLQVMQERVQDKLKGRNVVMLARGRIATVNDKMEITKGMLSIWKPNEAILELFKEGCWVEIMNTVPTAIRYSEIQITAGRQSAFRATKSKNKTPHLMSLKRTCYKISDVTQNPTMTTDYNEIDTVGVVFLIEPSNREFESNINFQNVYLADAEKNIISVNFWGGVNKFGFENILDTGQIVACANLQKRAGNTRKNIPQFRVTEFSHFTKTPKNVQAREMVEDLNKKLYGLDRRKFCDDCIEIKNNYSALRCFSNNENESPYRFNKSDYSFARNKMFIDTPQGVKPNKNEDMNFNLTGLDFESSFQQETQSPRTMLRKKKVNEKIAKLKMYGEPPPLSPISIINKSVNTKNSYKSPLISVSSSVATTNILPINSVTTVYKLPEESPKTRDTDRDKSPVISRKRAYVRSVPVKLSFADEKQNDSVDHFAEEFDGSPPLSLD